MKQIVVLTEARVAQATPMERESLHRFAQSGSQAGHYVVGLPSDWQDRLDDVLSCVPRQITQGLYNGFYHGPEIYEKLYNSALQHGIRLPNTPAESAKAMDLSQWASALGELTAKSYVITSDAELEALCKKLHYPVFVKGTIKSRKEEGWEACVVKNKRGLQEQWRRIDTQALETGLVVRELLPLRRKGSIKDFPLGREYRLLLFAGKVVSCNYYWGVRDPFGTTDLEPLHKLALEAQKRLEIPLLMVDVGQLENGSWRVIEVGDPQYSLFSFSLYPEIWQKLGR